MLFICSYSLITKNKMRCQIVVGKNIAHWRQKNAKGKKKAPSFISGAWVVLCAETGSKPTTATCEMRILEGRECLDRVERSSEDRQ